MHTALMEWKRRGRMEKWLRCALAAAGVALLGVEDAAAKIAVGVFAEKDARVRCLKATGSALWIGTDAGAYRFVADEVEYVGPKGLPVVEIVEHGEVVWLRTEEPFPSVRIWGDAYRWNGSTAELVGSTALQVWDIVPIGNQVWLGTREGIFAYDDEDASYRESNLSRLFGSDEFLEIVPDGDDVWLSSENGAYRAKDGRLEHIGPSDTLVWDISVSESGVLLATSKGIYGIVEGKPVLLAAEGMNVKAVAPDGLDLWFRTAERRSRVEGHLSVASTLFRYSDGRITEVDVHFPYWFFHRFDGDLWVIGAKRDETVADASFERVSIESLEAVQGQLYRLRGGRLIPDHPRGTWVRTVFFEGDEMWLGADDGAYRWVDDQWQRVGADVRVNCFASREGQVWFGTDRGVYEAVEASLDVNVKPADFWWRRLASSVLPGSWDVAGRFEPVISYRDSSGQPRNLALDREKIGVIIEHDAKEFEERLDAGSYTDWMRAGIDVPAGRGSVHLAVKDAWGNLATTSVTRSFVWGAFVDSVFISLAAFLLIATTISALPFIHSDLSWMMKPLLRRPVASILMLWWRTRRHLLRPYLRRLKREHAEATLSAELPADEFKAASFGRKLKLDRVVILKGPAARGREYLRYLARSFAESNRNLRTVAPFYFPLARLSAQSPAEMINAALRSVGLTSRALIDTFRDEGRILYLFDGLDDVEEERIMELAAFIHERRASNFICISTETIPVPFRGFPVVSLMDQLHHPSSTFSPGSRPVDPAITR